MQNKFISILTLYAYTQMKNFESQIHLVFLMEDYPDFLLNEINSLLKAASLEKQYNFSDKIGLVVDNCGRRLKQNIIQQPSLAELEKSIENNVENIIALDIALLKFIHSVPDRIEQNSFKLPQNADVPYLMNEYLSIKEKQVISKISKSYELYQLADFNSSFVQIKKLDNVIFNNNLYLTRIKKKKLKEVTGDDVEREHDYRLLVDFCEKFFENSKYRSISDVNPFNIPGEILKVNIDLRQILYTMASVFSSSSETHRFITQFFYDVDPTVDQNENTKAKRTQLSVMTIRECTQYATKIMILIIYFMFIEENNIISDNINQQLPKLLEEYRNQIILCLSHMINHLVEYIDFKAKFKENKIRYSTLPLIDVKNFDSKNQPITHLIYLLQYTLNFAPFLCNSI